MISISLHKLGKRYRREWIFRNLDLDIAPGTRMVILGGNGSGKSTLLQVISGFVMQSEGNLVYTRGEQPLENEEIRKYVSFAAPYLQLIEEFSAKELVEHTAIYKPFLFKGSTADILAQIGLPDTGSKPVRQFSSGMKQRLKLGLAILADTPVLLLDEPVSNLDRKAITWFQDLIGRYAGNRTLIVCSNAITDEYGFCTSEINVQDYKILK